MPNDKKSADVKTSEKGPKSLGKKTSGGKAGKKHKKDSQLIIRISSEERDRFIGLCDALDTSAAREIRGFIRAFLKEREDRD